MYMIILREILFDENQWIVGVIRSPEIARLSRNENIMSGSFSLLGNTIVTKQADQAISSDYVIDIILRDVIEIRFIKKGFLFPRFFLPNLSSKWIKRAIVLSFFLGFNYLSTKLFWVSKWVQLNKFFSNLPVKYLVTKQFQKCGKISCDKLVCRNIRFRRGCT